MGAADIARTANDRIDTGLLIKPCLGAVAHSCEWLLSCQLDQDRSQFVSLGRREGRIRAQLVPRHLKAAAAKGEKPVLHGLKQGRGANAWNSTDFDVGRAALGNDVDRLSTT